MYSYIGKPWRAYSRAGASTSLRIEHGGAPGRIEIELAPAFRNREEPMHVLVHREAMEGVLQGRRQHLTQARTRRCPRADRDRTGSGFPESRGADACTRTSGSHGGRTPGPAPAPHSG